MKSKYFFWAGHVFILSNPSFFSHLWFQAEYQKAQRERQELEDNYNSFKGMFHKTSPMVESHRPPASGANADQEEEEGEDMPDMDEYDAAGKNPFAWAGREKKLLET